MKIRGRGLPLLLAAAVGLQSACSLPVRPDGLAQRDKTVLGRIAVVTAGITPHYEFEALTTGKGDAAAKGAGTAALQCGHLVSGSRDAVGALVFLVCLPVSAMAGAIYGASAAASAQQLDAAKLRLQGAIAALRLQRQAVEQVLAYAREMELVLHDAGSGASVLDDASRRADLGAVADTVIEVALQKIRVVATGAREQQAIIWLEASVRVVDVRDGRLIDSLSIKEASRLRPVADWLLDDGAAIGGALGAASAAIAEQAIDEILLVYHPASPPAGTDSAGSETQRVPPYALRPLQPPIRNKLYTGARMTYGHLERYPLASLRPGFRWEAWPRGFDIGPGGGPGQAQDVRYDFRLFGEDGLAYERPGLSRPEHLVETPLRPCASYRWTARARFKLDGVPRATEWLGAYETMGGTVAPWWWRRGSGIPPLYVVPANVQAFYPIVETPGAHGGACADR